MAIEDDTQQTIGELGAGQVANPEESATSQEQQNPGETEGQEALDDSTAAPKKGVQKRIDELTSNWRNTERDRDYWRDLAMRNMREAEKPADKPAQTPQPSAPAEKPKVDAYESYDDYLEALTDWKVEQRETARQQETQQAQRQAQQQEKHQTFLQRAQTFRAEAPDFDAVAFNQALPVSDAMADVIRDSEHGPKLLYHLGKNPSEAARIAQLPPYSAAMELGKLEALMSLPGQKKTSSAPPPMNTLQGGGGAANTDPDKMSTDQWLKWREDQLKKKA